MARDNFILDTSALIAYLANEKGAGDVQRFLPKCMMPFISFSELYYIIWNKRGRVEADRIYGIVKSWNLPVLNPTERVILNAGRIKAIYRLGISDSYIAAFTLEHNSKLLTRDKDYLILKEEINILLV